MKRRSRCHSTAAFADSVVAQPFLFLSDAQCPAQRQHQEEDNRAWAVRLARQRLSDPAYPPRETLAEVATRLARLHHPANQS